ncbi:hypothetical protein, partial [Beijerinckia sp. L45]|uniref:hypothetical protein n=1 Tax=Beijerinckia sp. L45 TaxID=1641855 RepID=UPI00131D706E
MSSIIEEDATGAETRPASSEDREEVGGADRADQASDEAEDEGPNAQALPHESMDQARYAGEKQHREDERAYWWRSSVISAVAVVVAAVATVFAWRAFGEARLQADAAVAANRAWLSFEVAADGGLTWRDGLADVAITGTVFNLGR